MACDIYGTRTQNQQVLSTGQKRLIQERELGGDLFALLDALVILFWRTLGVVSCNLDLSVQVFPQTLCPAPKRTQCALIVVAALVKAFQLI